MGTNFRVVAGSVALVFGTAWSLNKNQSVDFTQDLNRNASVGIDAVFHNPAGVVHLATNGLHLGLGSQTLLQKRTIEESSPLLAAYGPSEYTGDIHSWVFPTLQAAYRMDDLTFFAHGGPYGGGGVGQFDQGLPQFDNMILGFANTIGETVKAGVDAQAGAPITSGASPVFQYKRDLSFTGDEMTLGGTAGAAYKIIPTLSVSAGYRFSYARNAYKGSAKVSQLVMTYKGSQGVPNVVPGGYVDSTINAQANGAFSSLWKDVAVDVVSTGVSHGVVLGADFKPDETWNVGLRFEWNGEMEIENETKTMTAPTGLLPFLSIYADGAKSKITEPMILAGGVSFKGVRNLTLESSWTYGFADAVDQGGAEKKYHNSLFGGLGLRYQVLSAVEVSTGYAHDWAYRNDDARTETEFDLPTNFFTAGLSVQASPRLKVNGGAMLGLGEESKAVSMASGASQTMNSNLVTLGIGLEWSPAM